MKRKPFTPLPWACLALFLFLTAPPAGGAYYKYVDKNGRLFFVDDPDKIPMAYRNHATEYAEPRDRLDETERAALDAREKEKQQQAKQRYLRHIKALNQRQTAESARKQAMAAEKRRNAVETPITIANDQILVPVTLGHQGVAVETKLLLDTGASLITLHGKIARQLKITPPMQSKAKVAGGAMIRSGIMRLSYVRVGPLTVKNPAAAIIDHSGPPAAFSGFLGMNILKEANFRIDFDRKVIRWLGKPENR